KTRRKNDDGSGRRHRGLVPALAASRDGPRAQPRVSAVPGQTLATTLRPGFAGIFRELSRPPVQPPLRAPPGRLLRAEPPRRGFRRDRRDLAHARPRL